MTGNPYFGKKDVTAFREACIVTPKDIEHMNELHRTPQQFVRKKSTKKYKLR